VPKDDSALRIPEAAIPKRDDEMVLINFLRPILFESIYTSTMVTVLLFIITPNNPSFNDNVLML
jgi:hypothetical protein